MDSLNKNIDNLLNDMIDVGINPTLIIKASVKGSKFIIHTVEYLGDDKKLFRKTLILRGKVENYNTVEVHKVEIPSHIKEIDVEVIPSGEWQIYVHNKFTHNIEDGCEIIVQPKIDYTKGKWELA